MLLPTHLCPWFMCSNNLFDETKLWGRDSTNQEEEKHRVVAGMWTTHLKLRQDIVISQCILRPSDVLILFPIIEQSVTTTPLSPGNT